MFKYQLDLETMTLVSDGGGSALLGCHEEDAMELLRLWLRERNAAYHWTRRLNELVQEVAELTWKPERKHLEAGITACRKLNIHLTRAPNFKTLEAAYRSGVFKALKNTEEAAQTVLSAHKWGGGDLSDLKAYHLTEEYVEQVMKAIDITLSQ